MNISKCCELSGAVIRGGTGKLGFAVSLETATSVNTVCVQWARGWMLQGDARRVQGLEGAYH